MYTIEIVDRLGRRAEQTLRRLGYKNVHVRVGDGYQGWPEHAPFDKIIVTCSPESIPQPLVDQLRDGGQMIIPVGERYQQTLYRVTKRGGELEREPLEATLFVPMTGAAEDARQVQPDPLQPAVFNGGFEQFVGESDAARRLALPAAGGCRSPTPDAPHGGRVSCRSPTSSRAAAARCCRASRSTAGKVSRLKLSCRVRGANLAADPATGGAAAAIVTFFDERRAAIDHGAARPLDGSFDWREESSGDRGSAGRPRGHPGHRPPRRDGAARRRRRQAATPVASDASKRPRRSTSRAKLGRATYARHPVARGTRWPASPQSRLRAASTPAQCLQPVRGLPSTCAPYAILATVKNALILRSLLELRTMLAYPGGMLRAFVRSHAPGASWTTVPTQFRSSGGNRT